MSQRIVFEFLENPREFGEDWARVKEALSSAGARLAAEPEGNPPYTLKALLPDRLQPRDFVSRLRTLPGVGRADVDEWRQAF